MTLLQKIADLMRKNEDTVASLSRKSGLPYTTIDGLFKKGYAGARISTIQAIARVYNVSLDYLIRDEIEDPRYGMPSPALSPEDQLLLQAFHQLTPAARAVLLSTAQNMLQEPSMRQDGSMSLAMLSAAG